MSSSTLTRAPFEIREGLTETPGSGGRKYRYIDGVVDGQAVIAAIEMLGHRSKSGTAKWLLVTYPDVAHFVGASHPTGLPIANEDQARQWVSFIAAMYAKAALTAVDL